eukprot:COSAG01_NODE_694_length_14205_cov_228.163122_4_plen_124_part_00
MESQAASGFRLRHRRRRSRPQTQQSVESRRRYSELSLRFRFHHRATTQEPRSRRLAVPAVRSQSRFEGGRFSELRETSMPLATDMQSRVAAMMQGGGRSFPRLHGFTCGSSAAVRRWRQRQPR